MDNERNRGGQDAARHQNQRYDPSQHGDTSQGYAQGGYGYGQSAGEEGYGARASLPQHYPAQPHNAQSDRPGGGYGARSTGSGGYGETTLYGTRNTFVGATGRDHSGGRGQEDAGRAARPGYDQQGANGGYGQQGAGGYGQSSGYARQERAQQQGGSAYHFDDHYKSWRDQQLAQHDRDYDEYRRHKQAAFHSEFEQWRQTRTGQSQGGQPQDAVPSAGTSGGTAGSGGSTGVGAFGSSGAKGNASGSTGSSSPATAGASR